MATSKTVLDNGIREKYMGAVKDFLEKSGEEVLITGSNEFALPCVDAEGNEKFIVLTFKVPTGERGGAAYNGYEEAEDYTAKCKLKAEKAKAQAEKKAAKIEADKKAREEKARLKALEKAEKGE